MQLWPTNLLTNQTKNNLSLVCDGWMTNSMLTRNFQVYEIPNTEAVTIFKFIEILKRFNLSFTKVREQCYDMPASMSGSKNGVAVKIRSLEPRAVYTHCYGHALNLACSDAIKRCPLLQDALDVSKEINLCTY